MINLTIQGNNGFKNKRPSESLIDFQTAFIRVAKP